MRIDKILVVATALFAGLFSVACFSDDSTLATKEISDIEISGIEEQYTATAFVGDKLSINPTITSGYKSEELAYEWTLLNSKTGKTDADGNVIEPIVLGNDSKLDIEVDVPSGEYQIRFQVTVKETGYSVIAAAKLSVVTEFSQGFYILKEGTDGNTELDLLTMSGTLSSNLITGVQGASLSGKPYNLSTNYGQFYIDEDDNSMKADNTIVVTTDAGELNVYRATDLKKLFDRNSILFDPMEESEIPYTIVRNGYYTLYFSSKGLRYGYADGMMTDYYGPNSGVFGFPVDATPGSRFVMLDAASYGCIYMWDEVNKSIMVVDNSLYINPLAYEDMSGSELTSNLTGYECIACGISSIDGTANFLLENSATGARKLYFAKAGIMALYLDKIVDVASGSHLAKGTSFSTNALQAKYIYCVDGGKVYACNLNSDDLAETELEFVGIGEGETISYVSNQYFNAMYGDSANNYDYLVIGTQKGDEYGVYMYNMLGGVPTGAPVKETKGTGKLHSVRYMSTNYSDTDLSYVQLYPLVD